VIRLVWVVIAALIAIFGSLFGLRRCDHQSTALATGQSTSLGLSTTALKDQPLQFSKADHA